MQPGNMPLSIYQGDSYRWRFTLWMDIERTMPLDLTAATPVAQIRDAPGGTLITAMDCTVTLPNIIDAVLTSANTLLLPTTGVWDLQLHYTNGDVSTSLAGVVTVTSDISQVAGPAPITSAVLRK